MSQGISGTAPNLLVLGGTREAVDLCRRLAHAGLQGTISLAGRVEKPAPQSLPVRIGGFGGPDGLSAYLQEAHITHVIDATHPFAATMSQNAVAACRQSKVPLIALTRPAWQALPGDRWFDVSDIAGAVAALDRPAARVMLATGRQTLGAFAAHPHHAYLVRVIDPPSSMPLPKALVVQARGPFTEADDRALLTANRIDLIVSKNSGGAATYSKIAAARHLGLPVVMIGRPHVSQRRETHSIDDVLAWIAHPDAALGV